MLTVGDVRATLANLLRTPTADGVQGSADVAVSRIFADTTLAQELLDFSPRVSLVAGLARMIRWLDETEQIERTPLEPVVLDD
jgi:nucleoside-diphosphate-sugar epimerase